MQMKHLIYIIALFLSFSFLACTSEEPKPEELALQAAKAYYDQLINGDYDSYVEGSLQGDTISPVYRQQLVLNMQMYIEKQKKSHQGIVSIEALRATADTASHTANAFLALTFGDSIREEITVPMIEKGGIWYLR